MTLREGIMKKIKDERVKFIRLQFTDILGVLKAITVTEDQIDKVLDGELMFDGSSIDGFVRIEESDMYLKPDLSTFLVLPWKSPVSTDSIARIICDVCDSEEKPFSGCPRQTLKKGWLRPVPWAIP